MQAVHVRTGIVVVAAVGALLAPPLEAQTPEPSRWWSEVDRVDDRLRKARWRKAERLVEELRTDVMRLSWREPDLGQVLSELAFQAAVVHAHRGDDEAAVWEWHVARAHERLAGPARGGPALTERDLGPYGRAAELLPAHPLREREEAPPGEELPEGTLFTDFEPASPPSGDMLPLENVNAARVRLPPVLFEVWVDPDGRVRQPLILSRWTPPIIRQWGFDSLRAMGPCTPARLKDEPVGSLVEVELEVVERFSSGGGRLRPGR